MLEFLLKEFSPYYGTCPITNPEDGCVAFLRDASFIKHLDSLIHKDVLLLAPPDLVDKLQALYYGK